MVLLSCKSNTFPAIIDVLCQKYHCLCCVLCQKALRFGAKCNPFWAKMQSVLGQNAAHFGAKRRTRNHSARLYPTPQAPTNSEDGRCRRGTSAGLKGNFDYAEVPLRVRRSAASAASKGNFIPVEAALRQGRSPPFQGEENACGAAQILGEFLVRCSNHYIYRWF